MKLEQVYLGKCSSPRKEVPPNYPCAVLDKAPRNCCPNATHTWGDLDGAVIVDYLGDGCSSPKLPPSFDDAPFLACRQYRRLGIAGKWYYI